MHGLMRLNSWRQMMQAPKRKIFVWIITPIPCCSTSDSAILCLGKSHPFIQETWWDTRLFVKLGVSWLKRLIEPRSTRKELSAYKCIYILNAYMSIYTIYGIVTCVYFMYISDIVIYLILLLWDLFMLINGNLVYFFWLLHYIPLSTCIIFH